MVEPREILRAAKQTPPLSQAAAQLMQLVGQPDHELGQICAIVEQDAMLTAGVLRVVNSASFGLRAQVDSIARAVSMLGESMIVGIAVGTCSPHVFDRALPGYDAVRGELWDHSLRTAIAARRIGRLAAPEVKIDPDVAFTGGILHGIGKSVLSDFADGRAEELLAPLRTADAADFAEAERQLFGLDHSEVGAIVAEGWGLPPRLVSCIRYHARPSECDNPDLRPLVYAVHLGSMISMMLGAGTGIDKLLYRLDQGYSEYFPLNKNSIEEVMLDTQTAASKTSGSVFENGGQELS